MANLKGIKIMKLNWVIVLVAFLVLLSGCSKGTLSDDKVVPVVESDYTAGFNAGRLAAMDPYSKIAFRYGLMGRSDAYIEGFLRGFSTFTVE